MSKPRAPPLDTSPRRAARTLAPLPRAPAIRSRARTIADTSRDLHSDQIVLDSQRSTPPRHRNSHAPLAPATSVLHAAPPSWGQVPAVCPRASVLGRFRGSRQWWKRLSRILANESHVPGTHLIAICAPSRIPPTIPLLRRMAIPSCSEARALFSAAATTLP